MNIKRTLVDRLGGLASPARLVWLWFLIVLGGFEQSGCFAQNKPDKPVLVINSGGHSSDIHGLAFTADGSELISTSNDHTIRFWDVKSGTPTRILRLPIYAERNSGKQALSPDGSLLAASMYGPSGDNWIALITLPEGRIRQQLKADKSQIYNLAFSPDGKLLASGTKDAVTRIWNVSSGKIERVLLEHRAAIAGVAFSPDSRRVVTASSDETARVWSLATGQTEAILRDQEERIYSMSAVAWSPDGRSIATGSLGTPIRIWNPDGTLLKKLPSSPTGRSIRFAKDSNSLLYAGTHGGYLFDLKRGFHQSQCSPMSEFAWSAAFSPDETLAAVGGRGGEELYVWRTANGAPVHRLKGPGLTTWGVGWSADGTRIGWGNTRRNFEINQPDSLYVLHPLEHSFSVAELDLGSVPDASFLRLKSTLGSLSLNRNNNNGWVEVKEGNQTLHTLQTGHSNTATFLPGGLLMIAGFNGMELFDPRTGKLIRKLVGHTSVINSVAPSADGRYLLSSAGDQTVRVWSVDQDEPLLSLFFANNDWIAWTPEGYYAASPGGEKLMGWHVNNGADQWASFYPASQFRSTYYRPDVIKLLLKTGNVARALEAADKARGRMTEKAAITEVLPPKVRITSPTSGHNAPQNTVEVRASATSVGAHPVTALRLLVDGRPYQGQKGVQAVTEPKLGEVTKTWQVELEPGKHKLKVLADSSVSQGVSDEVDVLYVGGQAETPRLPKLYVVAVGITDYPGDLKLNYATKDAEALASALKSHCKPLFRDIEVKTITDAKATRAGILKGLSWLRGQMTQSDYGIFFFAGHGELDNDGSLYFLSIDADTTDLVSSAVPADQVKRVLSGIPGKVITILDACHSASIAGSNAGKRRAAQGSLTDDLVRDLVTDENGVVAMCSSTGREFSLENNQFRQGTFTLSIIEGLSGKADFNKDGVVYLNELDTYVTDRVKELTRGQQHPVTAKPGSIRSFPLAKP